LELFNLFEFERKDNLFTSEIEGKSIKFLIHRSDKGYNLSIKFAGRKMVGCSVVFFDPFAETPSIDESQELVLIVPIFRLGKGKILFPRHHGLKTLNQYHRFLSSLSSLAKSESLENLIKPYRVYNRYVIPLLLALPTSPRLENLENYKKFIRDF